VNEEEQLTAEETAMVSEYLKNTGYGYPQEEEKTGLFNLFNKILKLIDTSKAANLDDAELMAIRTYQKLANYAEKFNLDLVSEYLRQLAEIDLATSLSKKGFFIEKVVTTKREMAAKIGKGGVKSKWFREKVQG